jgi:BACON domain-containing protein/fibronectin type III domain protein
MRLYQTGGIALIMAALVTMTEASAADVSPASLAFSALLGGSNPANQTLTLSKDNKRQFSWASSDNATWLSVTPTSGLLTRSTQIAVAVNTSGLAPGLYTGRVTININKRSLRVPVSLSITAPPAAPPPPPPQSTSATLTWSPNAETDLAGYKVYVGKASGIYGAPIIIGKQTSYTVSNLQLGNTYYFALSAYDINGNESALSAVTSKSIY